jgi:hypothetical protein
MWSKAHKRRETQHDDGTIRWQPIPTTSDLSGGVDGLIGDNARLLHYPIDQSITDPADGQQTCFISLRTKFMRLDSRLSHGLCLPLKGRREKLS